MIEFELTLQETTEGLKVITTDPITKTTLTIAENLWDEVGADAYPFLSELRELINKFKSVHKESAFRQGVIKSDA